MLVWVTDGGSSDPVGPPMQELKDLGVTVFIVSTGRGNLLELSAAASAPAEKHLHFVDVDDLHIITQALRGSILGRWEGAWGTPAGNSGRGLGRLQEELTCLEGAEARAAHPASPGTHSNWSPQGSHHLG